MALPRTWLPRAEEILDVLRRMKSQQLDRSAIEELFQLQRRAAIELMTQAGAVKGKPGSPALIDRTSLLAWTERVFKDESWHLQRGKQISEELSRSMAEVRELRAEILRSGKTPFKFPITEEYFRTNCVSLPSSVRIENRTITVRVKEGDPELMVQEACQLLYQLSMALGNDTEEFRKRLISMPKENDSGISSVQAILDSLLKGGR